jgi:sulfonate transport system permease protein
MKRKTLADYKILGIIVPIVLITLWQIASTRGWINQSILPAPSDLVKVWIKIISDGTLIKNILVSLKRVLLGYLVGASFGIVLGIILGLFPLAETMLNVLLEIFRPIPILAWVPVLILWAGIGEASKIITIAIGSFWSVLLNTTDGVRNVDTKYKEVASIYMKTKKDTIFSVILPAALPAIFTGLRIGIGSAWLSVVGAEMVAASSGLGYFISYSREVMKPARMYVGVFTVGIIGWLINILIRKLERYLLRWNTKGKE